MLQRRITKHQYQRFLEEHFGSAPHEVVGRRFLAVFFPGHEDVDVSEEVDVSVATTLIEGRYVELST